MAESTAVAPRGSSRNRSLIIVIGGVVLVLVLLLVGDRVADRLVEDRIGTELQTSLELAAPADVEIGGFPFLTQVVAQRFDDVTVRSGEVDLGADAVPLQDVDLRLTDVQASDGFQSFVAGHLEGAARIDYGDLSDLAGGEVGSTGDGRLAIEFATSVGSTRLSVTISGRPSLDRDDQTLTVTDPEIDLGGRRVPSSVASGLIERLIQPIDLSALPLNLKVTKLAAADTGLNVNVVGDDVSLAQR